MTGDFAGRKSGEGLAPQPTCICPLLLDHQQTPWQLTSLGIAVTEKADSPTMSYALCMITHPYSCSVEKRDIFEQRTRCGLISSRQGRLRLMNFGGCLGSVPFGGVAIVGQMTLILKFPECFSDEA